MKNKILIAILITIIFTSRNQVFALDKSKEKLYTNDNNITLTEKEMDFVNSFYGKDFFANMTNEDYLWIKDLNIDSSDISIKYLYDINPSELLGIGIKKSISHSTNYKKISIAKACNSMCTVLTKTDWLKNPKVRSYDLIGFRFYNTGLYNNTITTKLTSNNGTEYSSNNRVFSNGLGTSVKLPNNATNISIQQKIYTKRGGTVYASYQHAVSNISLETSLHYTIESGGLGNVFVPYNDAVGKFDEMNGVEIDL